MMIRHLPSITSALLVAGLLLFPARRIAGQGLDRMVGLNVSSSVVSIRPMSPVMRRPEAVPATAVLAMSRPVFTMQGTAPRSRALGAKRGFVVGLFGGALLGLVITNDFMDEPVLNVAVGAGVFGILGAGVGALVGATPSAARPPEPRGSHAP